MSHFGKGTMLIPTPKLVDALIRKVPKGKLVTVGELRRKMAADFEVDVLSDIIQPCFDLAAQFQPESLCASPLRLRKRIVPTAVKD
jgi:hypothetical protein